MITYERAKNRDYPKPICRYCFVPCDPKSREFRGMQACPYCYDDYADNSFMIIQKRRPDGTVSKP